MSMTRFIGLAAFLGAGYAMFRRTARRELNKPRAAPEHLQTWESEGGAVPVGGSRIAAAKPPKAEDLRPSRGSGEAHAASIGGDAPPLSIGTP
jgi:hypothetical protein